MPKAHACSLIQPDSPTTFVPDSEMIVIGEVVSTGTDSLDLKPEAFLKGPATPDEITFSGDDLGCPRADLKVGDRALVYVFDAAQPSYPLINQVYLLRDGRAIQEGSETLTEVEVVGDIRGLTGQYAVPASNKDDGAGIDWSNTVLPLGVVLLIIFGIGLVLMRVWHRIDPS
ncbi:MAG: hypothetical protein AB7N24_13820 [Dehalococcoidia bacterium]